MSIAGGCLCGAVRFELDGPIEVINYCHCSRCRRRTGSAFATIAHAQLADFRLIAGEERIATFAPEGWSRRSFCRTCGSPLPGLNTEDGEVGIPAGLLEEDPGTRPRCTSWSRPRRHGSRSPTNWPSTTSFRTSGELRGGEDARGAAQQGVEPDVE